MDATEQDRDTLRAWIRTNLTEHGLSARAAAKEMGIATTTLTKFLNDPTYKFTPTTTVIAKMERLFSRQAPRSAQTATPLPPLEATPAQPGTLPAPQQAALTALINKRRHVEPWLITGTSLQAAGVRAGDIVLVDLDEPPAIGDVVCAEVHENGTRRTVFRLYQKPYLVGATFDPAGLAPMLPDDRTVIMRGVVTDRLAKARGS